MMLLTITMMLPSTSTSNLPKIPELDIPIYKGETVSDQDQVMDTIKLLTLSNNSLCRIITLVDPLVGLRDRTSPSHHAGLTADEVDTHRLLTDTRP